MNEADFKRYLVKAFQKRGCYARRIEDSFSVGFPDLVLGIPDLPVFFTEAKIVKGRKFGPTPRQYVELKRLAITKHSCPTLLGFDGFAAYLHPHIDEAMKDDCLISTPDEHIVDFFVRYHSELRNGKWKTAK